MSISQSVYLVFFVPLVPSVGQRTRDSNVALAFLPLIELESTLDELRNWEFDKDSDNLDEMEKFRDVFMDYITKQWVEGSFPPRVWNCWKKLQNTNNMQEGYNSKINKERRQDPDFVAIDLSNTW